MTELTHVELYNQIEQGIIPDLKPYIDKGEDYRGVIATTGQYVDELVAYGEVGTITTLIDRGYAHEYYELWKNHENAYVRRTLAAKGLWPKDYIHDSDTMVRSYVLKTHPEFITPGFGKSPSEWIAGKNALEALPTITIEQIDMVLAASEVQVQGEQDLAPKDVYDLKRESLLTEPTVIERTMLPSELYKLGNPLWARNASINQIRNMKLYENEARHEGNFELFLEQFDKLLSVSDDYMRGVNIMRTSGAGMPF